MTKYDIRTIVRGQHRGNLRGVGRQLTRMASGASSITTGSSTSIPGPTPAPAQQVAIPDLVHR